MVLQEKFDSIIDCIENLVRKNEEDIPQTLARETGINPRMLGDAFRFIADMTLIKYIRQRRLVFALSNKIKRELSVEDIVSEAGFADAASFSKACKSELGISPAQITEKHLKDFVPMYFSRVTALGKNIEKTEGDNMYSTKTKDSAEGVTAEQFAEIRQVLELGAIYGLDDNEAESVYRIAHHCGAPTEKVVAFYDDFKHQIENGTYVYEYDLFEMAEIACGHGLSFSHTQELMYMLRRHGFYSIHDLPDEFLGVYFSDENEIHGWSVPYICEIAETLEDHKLTADDIDDIAFQADMAGVDLLDAIENYHTYKESWDRYVKKAMTEELPEDETDGFGYTSIWELDEQTYEDLDNIST